jgi:RNA polymerase sigma factor (TIGR02999 family)
LKLVGSEAGYRDRVHFFALAARAMRMILVDSVRSRRRIKRGGGAGAVSLDEAAAAVQAPDETLLALDQLLTRLSTFDPRKARILELHYFGGLSYDEIAAETGVSTATVHRELRLAKIWLANGLGDARQGESCPT